MPTAIQHVAKDNERIFYQQEPEDEYLAGRIEFELNFAHHNASAGCGVPLVYRYRNLGQCLSFEAGYADLAELSMDLLRALRDTPHESVRVMSPQELAVSPLAAIVQIMIKDEPHSRSKFAEERFRVISRCAAQFVIVERVLYGALVDANISRWREHATKVGMGLSDRDNEELWNYVEAHRASTSASSNDVKGWDGSVPPPIHEANTELLLLLTGAWGRWENIIRNLEYVLQHAIFMLSNGEMYAMDSRPKQLSGRFLTAFNNSNMRNIASFAARVELDEGAWGIFMGDDTVEDGAQRDYARLGLVVTDERLAPAGQRFDFCSHLYVGGPVAIPSNWGRSLYKLMSKPYSELFLEQFLDEMRWLMPVEGKKSNIASIMALLSWSGWLPNKQ